MPTRGRPDNIVRLIRSIEETVDDVNAIELIVRFDNDDDQTINLMVGLESKILIKPICLPRPKVLSQAWNEAWYCASGDIFMLCGDDIIFRTNGWDTRVRLEFDKYHDKILVVYGRDGIQNELLATHSFVHRNWTDAIGYFTPHGYMYYNDVWIHNLGKKVSRLVYMDDVFIEHMHHSVGKSVNDDVYCAMGVKHIEDTKRYDSDNDQNLLQVDTNRLKQYISDFTTKRPRMIPNQSQQLYCPSISIIIPTHNHLNDLLIPCLKSIQDYTDLNMCEIIVVANGCTDGTVEYLKTLPYQFRHVVLNDKSGYTVSTNSGIKVAKGEYILLLNNDVVILPQAKSNWIQVLMKPHIMNNKTGVSGPVKFTFECGSNIKTAMAFWCVMIPAMLFDELGLLDEIFSPGMGEDADFSIKAELAGYALVQVPNDTSVKFGDGIPVPEQVFPIYHKGSGTFGDDDYSKISAINTDLLRRRYGFKNKLEKLYNICLNHKCDINELFPTLRRYGEQCSHITEFGVRNVFSTWAFLVTKPDKYVGYDIESSGNISEAKSEADNAGIMFEFNLVSTLSTDIERTDLLFIDTKHTYVQLKAELDRHSNNVNKFILIHDTVSYGVSGEDGGEGELRAINEFLLSHNEWSVKEDLKISNGLIVLERCLVGDSRPAKPVPNSVMKSASVKIMKKVNKCKFSIVVPTCHNFEKALKPCIEAIMAYTNLADKEIIVVANGTPDIAIQYVKSKSIKLLEFNDRIGYIRAINAGIRAASGDYVITLDDDSILQPQERNAWIDLLYAPFIDSNVGASGPFSQAYDDLGEVLHSGCTMYNRNVITKLGLFDEAFHPGYMGDEDLSIRIRKAGYQIKSVPEGKPPQFINGVFSISFPVVHTGDVATMPKTGEDLPLVSKNRQLLYDRHLKKNENFDEWFHG
jgi:glycosyl transferase/beta-hydroxylase protein BlmF